MAEIGAGLVKELRARTGLGMMECKKALAEADGNLEKAEELLRIRSGAKASKAADRIAAEGVIGAFVSPDAKCGALVELNCETDFVAKNEDFLTFAKTLAERVAHAAPSDVAALSELRIDGTSVEARRQALVQRIGENIAIRRFQRIETAAHLALYVHSNRIGVLVDFDGPEDVGKDVAMHVAFAKPQHLSKSEVPNEIVERERRILAARARESGKTAEIATKMVEGGVNKFLAEITLLGQPFIKDDKKSVEKMLAARKASLHRFAYLVVGEGLEKRSSDFAAEVLAQASVAR